jgi:serine/threonine protein kinase
VKDESDLTAGQVIGSYQIISLIGRGGMGEVYLALDVRLGRKVALKLLPASVTGDRTRLRRFEQEARAASGLNHPNILTIHGVEEVDGRRLIATEFIDGVTLRQRMAASAINIHEALDIAIHVASALVAAHRLKIVHRDIKPENIMVRTDDGLVKVLDFGLAKPTGTGPDPSADPEAPTRAMVNTGPGVLVGTVAYMSPEQARGQEVDERTDIWCLGVVLYEMIAGKVPFAGRGANEIISQILSREQPAPLARFAHDVPAELEGIVAKALTKDREERYQTSKDLLIDLKRLKQRIEVDAEIVRVGVSETGTSVSGSSGQASTESAPDPIDRTTTATDTQPTTSAEYLVTEIKRHKRGVVLALAITIVAGAGIAYWLYKSMGQRSLPSQPIKITRLTTTGRATSSAISPDGKYVVYSQEEGGQESLWLSQVALSNNVQIIPPAAVNYRGVTFSRDGNLIYYVTVDQNNQGVLYQSPALGGGGERKLLEGVQSPVTFSPDGKLLAFLRRYPANPGGDALMIANADGTEDRVLFALKQPNLFGNFGAPAWSPDGKVIACGVQNYSGSFYSNVVGVRVADGTATQITSQKWDQLNIGRVAWLADGSGLLLTVSDQPGDLPQIWQLPYPVGEARRIVNDLDGYSDLTVTADSSVLATVRTNRFVNIWVGPSEDSRRAGQITSGTERDDGLAGLDWTPDGKIVYRSQAGGAHIWIMGADGSGSKQLLPFAAANPSVTADGHYVVWTSKGDGVLQLWRADIDGSNQRQLTQFGGAGAWFPRLSPDGKWVVFGNIPNGSFHTLWRVSIDGSALVQLTNQPSWVPVVSPDGKLIACNWLDETSGQWKMAIIPFEGGMPIKIFDNSGVYNRRILWTPDGRAIAYIQTNRGVSNIWAQPLDGGSAKQLTDFKDQRIFNFSWSRDGKQLALSRGIVNSDVVLVSSFR